MSNQTIAVIDYGMGNLRSVSKALEHVAPQDNIIVTSNKDEINNSDKIIFPGVGAISHCMKELENYDLISTIKKSASEKPFLGICLGMQLLLNHSEENGGTKALEIINGQVPKFPDTVKEQGLSIPHMGWNRVSQSGKHPLWDKIKDDSHFYFVHSYYVEPIDSQHISSFCNYGINFTSSIAKENIFATQFHPEKSQDNGLQLLKNFSNWDGKC